MYKIEKGIPLVKRKGSNTYVSVLERMEVGDSFQIETNGEAIKFQSARQNLKPKKFSVRRYEGKFRCWRIS